MKGTAPALGHFVPNLLRIYQSKVQFKKAGSFELSAFSLIS